MTAGMRAARVSTWTGVASFVARHPRPYLCASEGSKAKKVDWADLIGRIAESGDRDAFKSLFEHFAPRIKGFMLKAGCSADEAEEVAQNTLLAVWRKAAQFDRTSAGAAAWIFTIARNLRIDAVRRAAREGAVGQGEEADVETDPDHSAEVMVLRREDAARVTAAILRLPAEQATVIRMAFIEERPHSEIASVLGIPLGTVKSRIRLATSRLRDLLDDGT